MDGEVNLVKHTVPDTSEILVNNESDLPGEVRSILKNFDRVDSIHIEVGKDIEVKCWEKEEAMASSF